MRTKKDIQKIEILKPTNVNFRQSKKGAAFLLPLILFGIGFVIGGPVLYILSGGHSDKPNQLKVVEDSVKNVDADSGDASPVILASCGDDRSTKADFIAVNPLDEDGTPTYHSLAIKVKKADGSGALRSYTTASDGGFAASSLGLVCGESYVAYVPAVTNTSASGMVKFTTNSPYYDAELEIDSIDYIHVKAYDNKNHGDVYDTSDADATDYEDLANGVITFRSTTDNTTAYDMGVGGELDMTFTLKTDAQKSWGDLKNYIAIDADTSDYGEPAVFFNGMQLKEVGKAALSPDDAGYLSGYEYIYELPQDITEVSSELRLKVTAKASQDPDSDIQIQPIAESYWVDGTNIKRSIFKSDGTPILTSFQVIKIDIV